MTEEEAALLAELKAISNNSAGANRFTEDSENGNDKSESYNSKDDNLVDSTKTKLKQQNGGLDENTNPTSTGKRNSFDSQLDSMNTRDKSNNNATLNKEDSNQDKRMGGFGTPSDPKTFKGEFGGAAEDADLLAELRAISMQSSAGRFAGGNDDGNDNTNNNAEIEKAPPQPKAAPVKKSENVGDDALPPWKRKTKKKAEVPPWKRKSKPPAQNTDSGTLDNVEVKSPPTKAETVEPVVEERMGGFDAPSDPKTFKGEFGGAAEDADLLAELRAISMQSSAGRFAGGNDDENDMKGETVVDTPSSSKPSQIQSNNLSSIPPQKPKITSYEKPVNSLSGAREADSLSTPTKKASSIPASPSVVDANNDEIIVTLETVHDALGSKNWKFRRAAYELLLKLVNDEANGRDARNIVNSDQVLQSLDELVPSMLKESNAAALDSALRFVLVYADHCTGASNASQAQSISEMLTSGPALSSSRPSTSKLVKPLYLKLMEVGNEGVASIHAVVESLLALGLTSKKPKVVANSVLLILDAAHAFGAASLPLGKISLNASKMLEHSNRNVRGTAINILAEICRAVGSKDPLEEVISKMKSAQVSELDSLLAKQSDPVSPTVGLRHQTSGPSPGDALAVLQAGAEAAAADSYASRKSVNIFKELNETEFAAKMKEKKWSEKAGALDILLKCGGEKPYKLEQPSNSVNYCELIHELKRLLEHTHFAVKSKSMNALAMLAEGVGEKLFPFLRPLLLPVILLSKDKKLKTPTKNCVDVLFGNILTFDHLLDKEDGLPSVLDEKVEKTLLFDRVL